MGYYDDDDVELDPELEKKLKDEYKKLSAEFNAECKPIEDAFYKVWGETREALAKVSEKHGLPAYINKLSYAPNSYETIHSKEMKAFIREWDGSVINEDYGQDFGEWWAPSTC